MIVKDFYKKEGIIKIAPTDTLAKAIHSLSSSHDTAFVEEDGNLLGIVSPYHAIIKKHSPPATKVVNCMVTPPKIMIDDTPEEVARQMIESKMHFLPVYADRKWVGHVSVRRLLSVVIDNPVLGVEIGDTVGYRQSLVTIGADDTVANATSLFKKYNISKLVVVDENMKLSGILSQYDIMDYLITPRDRQSAGDLGGVKIAQNDAKVRNFYTTSVLTTKRNSTYQAIAKLMVDKHKGSVVIVDEVGRPVEIVTLYDVLSKLISIDKKVEIKTQLVHVNPKHNAQVELLISQLSHHLKHLQDMSEVTLTIEEQKNGGVIEIKLHISHAGDKPTVIEKAGKNFAVIAGQIVKAIHTLISKQ